MTRSASHFAALLGALLLTFASFHQTVTVPLASGIAGLQLA